MFNLGRAEVAETSNVLEMPRNSMQRPSRCRNIFQELAISDGHYLPIAALSQSVRQTNPAKDVARHFDPSG